MAPYELQSGAEDALRRTRSHSVSPILGEGRGDGPRSSVQARCWRRTFWWGFRQRAGQRNEGAWWMPLAVVADEGRGKATKRRGELSSERIRGFPNGATWRG